MSGDWLLFINNVVLGLFFLPTLFKKGANVHWTTAVVYVGAISVGAAGYFWNSQFLPGVPTAIGAAMWLIMLGKSVRIPQRF